ncbi:hypothetical protein GQF00_09060 [Alcanivorax sp. DP30]|nr:hypothetical protein [Alcanivorax sp. DP30]
MRRHLGVFFINRNYETQVLCQTISSQPATTNGAKSTLLITRIGVAPCIVHTLPEVSDKK